METVLKQVDNSKIEGFKGEFRVFSNFYPSWIVFEDVEFPCVENAYQAAKTNNPLQRMGFDKMNASDAKKLGRSLTLRPDWEVVKHEIMYRLCYEKFKRHTDLQKILLSTGEREIEETNYWNDTYWGVCRGVGQNKLGLILMQVRSLLRL